MAKFVNIDGYWINPEHVESVEHRERIHSPVEEVIVQTRSRAFVLEGWTEKQACEVVDKLEKAK